VYISEAWSSNFNVYGYKLKKKLRTSLNSSLEPFYFNKISMVGILFKCFRSGVGNHRSTRPFYTALEVIYKHMQKYIYLRNLDRKIIKQASACFSCQIP